MMDLIGLVSSQQTAKEMGLESSDSPIQPESSDFLSVMEHYLNEDETSQPVLTDLDLVQNKVSTSPALENQAEIETESISDTETTQIQIVKEEGVDSSNKASIAVSQDKVDVELQDNIHLAWFDAESFEPPLSIKTELEQQESKEQLESVAELLSYSIDEEISASLGKVKNSIHEEDKPIEMEIPDRLEPQYLNVPILVNNEKQVANEVKQELKEISLTKFKDDNQKRDLQLRTSELQIEKQKIGQTGFDSEKLASASLPSLLMENGGEALKALHVAIPLSSATTPLQVQSSESKGITAQNLELRPSITESNWPEHFNQQILWLRQQQVNTAIIKLNPQEFGPLEVSIHLIKDETSINITTHTPQVRDLIEQAIPRLREMMTEQGLNLSQVNIESNGNQHQPQQQNQASTYSNAQPGEEQQAIAEPLLRKITKGLIDYFA